MGIYDREYYRRQGPSFLESFSLHGKVCKWLIAVNVGLFLLQLMTQQRAAFDTTGDGRVIVAPAAAPLTDALILNTDAVLHGQVWRLLTYAFLHDPGSLWHIVFNMLFLWWFGSEMEELYGHREFLTFYLLAAIFSGIAYFGWQLIDTTRNSALGASGAITAVMVLFALHYPNRQILLMMFIPVPIWLFVLFQVGQDTFTFLNRTLTYTAVTCHLGGALFGVMYYRSGVRLLSLWPDWRMPRVRSRPKLRVYREEEEKAQPVSVAAPPSSGVDEHLEAQLDKVLEKVGRTGKESLTEQERAILLRAAEVYKRRKH